MTAGDGHGDLSTPDPPAGPDAPRDSVRIVDASTRHGPVRCAACGRATTALIPRGFRGQVVHLCSECAASRTITPPPEIDRVCGACDGPLYVGDGFCGRCGTRVPHQCPACGAGAEPDDRFCGSCGSALGTAPVV